MKHSLDIVLYVAYLSYLRWRRIYDWNQAYGNLNSQNSKQSCQLPPAMTLSLVSTVISPIGEGHNYSLESTIIFNLL